MKVFYSWQSDLGTAHKNFIRNALQRAITDASEDLVFEEADRPEMDEATKGEAGMVDIAATVLRKISECTAFVADITPVCEAPNGKKMPNSNVVFELGYAYAKPGQTAIIAIINEAVYKPDDLPFDLRGKRVMTYKLSANPTSQQREGARNELTKALTGALKLILGQEIEVKASTTEIEGVLSEPNNPTVWQGSKVFQMSAPPDVVHLMPTNQRAYLRVIPAKWRVPSIADVEDLSDNMSPSTARSRGAGHWGAVDFGFVNVFYGDERPDGSNWASAVAAFHEQSGEWWFIDQASVFKHSGTTYFDPLRAVCEWKRYIRNANVNLDRLGAPSLRKVIVGAEGVKDAVWPGLEDRRYRKDSLLYSAQLAQWTAVDEMVFLREAYNEMRNGYAQPHVDQTDFDQLIERYERQW